MIKDKKNTKRKTAEKLKRFKEKKIQLVKENPKNSIVFVFQSPVIKERFSKISREVISIKKATLDFWGYLLNDEDKTIINNKFERVKELAKKIIELSKELGDFEYAQLASKSLREKIKIIENEDSPLVEVFVPKSEEENLLYETLFRIDLFDSIAKRNEKAVEWISILKEYDKTLRDLKENAFNVFQKRIRAKHLVPYGAIRFEFKKWLKVNNIPDNSNN